MLGRTRKNLSIETANKVYKTFILPIIDYCDTVWNCCGAVNSNKIEKLQRQELSKYVLALVKKVLKNKCPQVFVNYFKFNKDCTNRFTRQSDQIKTAKNQVGINKEGFLLPWQRAL